ncbi:inositol-3-phosphate synthase [Nocardioides donggukensis]|uniref:Inositol-3-phosphate synthase n=1 Tax=Nocardioides donggukensis TaxID=2774019 RepID=A0A927KA98_9ACTN|nr:inositol-3-phosphate synthase [Nocardioides donggukensis]MBD8870641.1 inositol-3-phosphate synthase [Nocardioides donggukensis]
MTDSGRTNPARGQGRLGIWLVGARGSVGATTVVGVLAVRARLAPSTGLVSELPEVACAGLPGLDRVVLGGHDLGDESLAKRAERLASGGVLPAGLLPLVAEELAAVDGRLRPGYHRETGEPQAAAVDRLQRDLEEFRAENGLAHVVVVDVASTEAPVPTEALTEGPLVDVEALDRALAAGEAPLPASSAYVLAAYRAGCPVVSFTPSPGPRLPVLEEVARRQGLPWAGSDGKTGETLLKATLAPMFATRALHVGSWASYNMLGGGDGATLADPERAASKLATKARGLEAILGHPVEGPMHIDYVADHGEVKTAVDHVSFEGFLGARMSLQFTWTGYDSALAAPLVVDLARLVLRAREVGETGPLPLGFFFKDPAGSTEHRLSAQWDALVAWCARLGEGA